MTVDGPFADRPTTEPVHPRGPSAGLRDRRLRFLAVPVALALAVAFLVTGSVVRSAPPALAVITDPAAAGALATPALVPVLGPADARRPLTHEIFGFLPYWKMDAKTISGLRYDLLSTIAFFGVGIARDGALDTKTAGYRAYTGAMASRVTDRAHAKGVRVVPTFELFDKGKLTSMTAFLHDRKAQARFISGAVALMRSRHADGAVLDFEPLPERLSAPFAAFAADFGRAIHAKDRKAQLTVAMHQAATDRSIATIAGSVDRIFVMGYDYHWVGSSIAGAVAPLDGPGGDVRLTLLRFIEGAGRAKVILGVPYYGYDWPIAVRGPGAAVRVPASKHGGVWSIGYAATVDYLKKHPSVHTHWDRLAASPYFTYHDAAHKTDRQVWYENAQSLGAKYELAKAAGVAGVGIWALGMDRGRTDLWSLLRTTFGKKR